MATPELHRRRDGLLEIRVGWREFRMAWATAPNTRHIVLADEGMIKRPGVLNEARDTVTTLFPALWEQIAARYRRSGLYQDDQPRTRSCPQCGAAMTVHREYETVWAFRCEVCRSVEMMGKQEVGGTFGAGEKEST